VWALGLLVAKLLKPDTVLVRYTKREGFKLQNEVLQYVPWDPKKAGELVGLRGYPEWLEWIEGRKDNLRSQDGAVEEFGELEWDLIRSCLRWGPAERPKVSELLAHPVFRQLPRRTPSPTRIYPVFDVAFSEENGDTEQEKTIRALERLFRSLVFVPEYKETFVDLAVHLVGSFTVDELPDLYRTQLGVLLKLCVLVSNAVVDRREGKKKRKFASLK
jgi:hypothetical protein